MKDEVKALTSSFILHPSFALLLREQKFEHRLDALGPGRLAVLRADGLEVFQVAFETPAARDERVAERARVPCGKLALVRPHVEPDARSHRRLERLNVSDDPLVIPPDRRRDDAELAEDVRVSESEVQRHKPAEA